METLQKLYADYLAESTALRENASPFAGVFGMGDDPRKHPCHELFYINVGRWIEELIEGKPSGEAALEAARFLMEEPKKHDGTEGYWFLYACIGYIRSLIPFLRPENCKALAERFTELYPRRERMPVQKETLKMLQRAGK